MSHLDWFLIFAINDALMFMLVWMAYGWVEGFWGSDKDGA